MQYEYDQQHAAAGTAFNATASRTQPFWKGDHNGCDHRTGECNAKNGWMMDKNHRGVPIIVNKRMEKRFQSMVEFGDNSDRYPEPAHEYKGWVPASEAKSVRPSKAVIDALRDTGENEITKTLEYKKASFADTQAALKEWRTAFDLWANPITKEATPRVRA